MAALRAQGVVPTKIESRDTRKGHARVEALKTLVMDRLKDGPEVTPPTIFLNVYRSVSLIPCGLLESLLYGFLQELGYVDAKGKKRPSYGRSTLPDPKLKVRKAWGGLVSDHAVALLTPQVVKKGKPDEVKANVPAGGDVKCEEDGSSGSLEEGEEGEEESSTSDTEIEPVPPPEKSDEPTPHPEKETSEPPHPAPSSRSPVEPGKGSPGRSPKQKDDAGTFKAGRLQYTTHTTTQDRRALVPLAEGLPDALKAHAERSCRELEKSVSKDDLDLIKAGSIHACISLVQDACSISSHMAQGQKKIRKAMREAQLPPIEINEDEAEEDVDRKYREELQQSESDDAKPARGRGRGKGRGRGRGRPRGRGRAHGSEGQDLQEPEDPREGVKEELLNEEPPKPAVPEAPSDAETAEREREELPNEEPPKPVVPAKPHEVQGMSDRRTAPLKRLRSKSGLEAPFKTPPRRTRAVRSPSPQHAKSPGGSPKSAKGGSPKSTRGTPKAGKTARKQNLLKALKDVLVMISVQVNRNSMKTFAEGKPEHLVLPDGWETRKPGAIHRVFAAVRG